jgi:hypothetical protein
VVGPTNAGMIKIAVVVSVFFNFLGGRWPVAFARACARAGRRNELERAQCAAVDQRPVGRESGLAGRGSRSGAIISIAHRGALRPESNEARASG